MDANTTKGKTLAAFLAALMVGSLLVSGFVAAHEEDGTSRLSDSGLTDPSGSTNAILHRDYDCDEDTDEADCDDNEDTDFYVDSPSSGEILYLSTYDLFFVGIPGCFNDDGDNSIGPCDDATFEATLLSEDDDVSLYLESYVGDVDPDGGDFDLLGDAENDADCDTDEGFDGCDILLDTEDAQLDEDEDHCGAAEDASDFGSLNEDEDGCEDVFTVAFEAVSTAFGAGTYYLVDEADDMVIGVFEVSEREDLELVLDPDTFTYIYEEEPEVDAVLTNEGDGVESVFLESENDWLETEVVEGDTSSSGRTTFDFDTVHPPAGTWLIIGRQDVSILDGAETPFGDIEDEEEFDDTTLASEPDLVGEAWLTIETNTLVVEPDSTAVLSGFRQSASYQISFPEDDENDGDHTPVDCDGEEGLNVVFPGDEAEDVDAGDGPACTDGLLYGVREFEVANVSVRAPNGDEYFLNMSYEDWADGVTDMPMIFCVDADEDEAEDDCSEGDDDWDAPLLVTLEADGRITLTPNVDFEHPLEAIEDDIGPLSEDNQVWTSGSYNITVDVSTSGRGTNGDGSSYTLGGDDGEDEWGEAADFPEYSASWDLTVGDAADLNLELFVDPAGGEVFDDAVAADSVDVQDLAAPIPTQTLFIIVYGETIDDHPLCQADVWQEAGEDDADLEAAEACDDPDFNDELDEEETLAEAEEDFLDSVEVSGDLLPGFEIASYDAVSGVLMITGVTPTQDGNITVTITHEGDTATLTIPVENGARIELDVDSITVGEETDVTVTIRDEFGGLVTTADLTLVHDDGTVPDGDFDMSPSSGEISGTGAAGRGLGGEYTYAVTPDTNEDIIIFAIVGEGDGEETYAYALLSVNPASDLNVELVGNDSAMASVTTPVILDVTPGWDDEDEEFEIEEVSVWFIHEDGWEDFEADGAEALEDLVGEEADEFEWDDAAFEIADLDFGDETVYMNVTLPPGQYKILVCDVACDTADATHDNADNMIDFTVEQFVATFTPTQVANDEDIEENVRVQVRVVDANGRPANGILESIADDDADFEDETTGEFEGDESTTITAVITNGWGNFTGVTGGSVGTVGFLFDPSGSSEDPTASPVEGSFEIVGPNITVTPSSVRIGAVTLVTIDVGDNDGDGLPGRVIRLCAPGVNDFPTDEDDIEDFEDEDIAFEAEDGEDFEGMDFEERFEEACPTTGVTGADGVTTIAVNPTTTTPFRVYVNNTYSGTDIPVVIGTLAITLSPTNPNAGQTVTVTATLTGVASGSNAGVNVRVTRDGTQVLNQATDTNGRVTIPAVSTGNYTVVASRTGFPDATATFTVGAQQQNNTNQSQFRLSNLVLPTTIAVGSPVTVSVDVENTGNANGTATAILLVNNAQRDTRSVTLNASEEETVTYNFTPTVAGTYAVSVRIGNTTIGPQNITVGTPTTTPTNTTTPVTNTTTPVTTTTTTPPPTNTTTTPTVSTPATTPTEPTVPGFEVVALLAALGIALLVLRRRNN